MTNDNNLKDVYETLKREGYTPPEFDEFVKDMQDDSNLRDVHSTLKKSGYTPPEYEEFKKDMFGTRDNGGSLQDQTIATSEKIIETVGKMGATGVDKNRADGAVKRVEPEAAAGTDWRKAAREYEVTKGAKEMFDRIKEASDRHRSEEAAQKEAYRQYMEEQQRRNAEGRANADLEHAEGIEWDSPQYRAELEQVDYPAGEGSDSKGSGKGNGVKSVSAEEARRLSDEGFGGNRIKVYDKDRKDKTPYAAKARVMKDPEDIYKVAGKVDRTGTSQEPAALPELVVKGVSGGAVGKRVAEYLRFHPEVLGNEAEDPNSEKMRGLASDIRQTMLDEQARADEAFELWKAENRHKLKDLSEEDLERKREEIAADIEFERRIGNMDLERDYLLRRYKERRAEIENDLKADFERRGIPPDGNRWVYALDAALRGDAELRALDAQGYNLGKAAERYEDWLADGRQGPLANYAGGIGSALKDFGMNPFGLADLQGNTFPLMHIKSKLGNGELTQDEVLALEAYFLNQETQGRTKMSLARSSGEFTGALAEMAAEFGLNPASGLARRTLARIYAEVGKDGAMSLIRKSSKLARMVGYKGVDVGGLEVARNLGKVTAAALGEGAVMAVTTQAGKNVNAIAERTLATPVYDRKGNLVGAEGESGVRAGVKTLGSSALLNSAFVFPATFGSRAMRGFDTLSQTLHVPFGNPVDALVKMKTGEALSIITADVAGRSDLDPTWRDFADPEKNGELIAGLLAAELTSGAMKGGAGQITGSYLRHARSKAKRAMMESAARGARLFSGEDGSGNRLHDWAAIVTSIYEGKEETIQDCLQRVAKDKDMTREQKEAAIDYARAAYRYIGAERGYESWRTRGEREAAAREKEDDWNVVGAEAPGDSKKSEATEKSEATDDSKKDGMGSESKKSEAERAAMEVILAEAYESGYDSVAGARKEGGRTDGNEPAETEGGLGKEPVETGGGSRKESVAMSDVLRQVNEAEEAFEDAFGSDSEYMMSAVKDDPWGLVEVPELTAAQRNAVMDVINANEVLKGAMDALDDKSEDLREQAEREVERRTHKKQGKVVPATMKADDSPVYVISGDVAMFPDGSGVDVSKTYELNPSGVIYILDETGRYRPVSPEELLRVGDAIDPALELQGVYDAIEREQEAIMSEAVAGASKVDESGEKSGEKEEFSTENRVSGTETGSETGDSVGNGHEIQPIGKGKFGDIFDSFKGRFKAAAAFLFKKKGGEARGVFHRDEIGDIGLVWGDSNTGLSHIIQKHIIEHSDYDSVSEMLSAIKEVIADGDILIQKGGNYRIEKDGKRVIIAKNDEGNFVITSYDNNRSLTEKKRSEADATLFDQRVQEEMDGALVPSDLNSEGKDSKKIPGVQEEEGNWNIEEFGEGGIIITPDASLIEEAMRKPSALERIARDEQGTPLFESADPELAWDALVEDSEDATEAEEYATGMIKVLENEVEKAEKKVANVKVTGDRAKYKADKEAARKELEEAGKRLAHWQAMLETNSRRKEEAQAAADEEARRIEAEKAEKAEKERQERERRDQEARAEAERRRREKEERDGIPDMIDDTPENARKRGKRRSGSTIYTRQETITDKVEGKEVTVDFNEKRKGHRPKGRIVVIEASQGQASHMEGKRNPLFFIDEAQPKDRVDAESILAEQRHAREMNPSLITDSRDMVDPFRGAPTVNLRGETIQGNHRMATLRYMYANEAESSELYRNYILDHALEFGFTPEQAEAISRMEEPILVNMVDVDDAMAIELGQDTGNSRETGGKDRIDADRLANAIGDKMGRFMDTLLTDDSEEGDSLRGLIRRNGLEALKYLRDMGKIDDRQYSTAINKDGSLSDEGIEDIEKFIKRTFFVGESREFEEMFNALPAKAQSAILAQVWRDAKTPESEKVTPHVKEAVKAFYAMQGIKQFKEARSYKEALQAAEMWRAQTVFNEDGEILSNRNRYSNFAIKFAAMLRGASMKETRGILKQMLDWMQGANDQGGMFDMEESAETAEDRTFRGAVKKVLGMEYQAGEESAIMPTHPTVTSKGEQGEIRNGKSGALSNKPDKEIQEYGNGENGGTDVAGHDQAGTPGEQGSNGDGSGREPSKEGGRPSESGAGTGAVEEGKTSFVEAVRTLFEKGKEAASKLFQRAYFDVVSTPEFMKGLGLTGDKFTIRYGVISRHFGKDSSHDITIDEWERLPEAIRTPFAISRLEGKEKGYRIYTTLKNKKGEYVVVGVDVKNAGRNLEVNAISTVFGRREDGGLTSQEEIIYKSEKITPEQQSLLDGPNSHQYPADREHSDGKDNVKPSEKQEGAERAGKRELTEEDLSGIDPEESGIEESIIDGARDYIEGERTPWSEMCYKTVENYVRNTRDDSSAGGGNGYATQLASPDAEPARGGEGSEGVGGDEVDREHGGDDVAGGAQGVLPSPVSTGQGTVGEGHGGIPEAGSSRKGEVSGGRSEVLPGKRDDQGEGVEKDASGLGLFQEDGLPVYNYESGIQGGSPGGEGVAATRDEWKSMDGAARQAEASRFPLTEEEIDRSRADAVLKANALSYLEGKRGFAREASYLKIYEDVRYTDGDIAGNSGTGMPSQLAGTDHVESDGRREGGEGGDASGTMGGIRGDQDVASTVPDGKNSEGGSYSDTGKGGDQQVSGEAAGVETLSAGSAESGRGRTVRSDGGDGRASGGGGRGRSAVSDGRGTSETGREGDAGASESVDDYLRDAWDEFKDVLKDFIKGGLDNLSVSLAGLSSRQIELLPRLIMAGAKAGYGLLRKGLTSFAAWSREMRKNIADLLRRAGFRDSEIDEFIREMWDCDFPMDGETRTIGEWASVYDKARLREKVGMTLEEKREAQKAAEGIAVKQGEIDNIRETLPYLLPQQQEDVLRAETQFFDKSHSDREHGNGKGYMFTNGTGTGKTYTGLGIVKRFIKQGKCRVLILTPSQPKVSDWIKDASNLGIDLRSLEEWSKERGTNATAESGEGAVITTYANFRQNDALLKDTFDLVVYDESHRILENKKGLATSGAKQHYLVSNRDENYAYQRLRHTDPTWMKYKELSERFEEEYARLLDKVINETGKHDLFHLKVNMLIPPSFNEEWPRSTEERFPELARLRKEIFDTRRHFEEDEKPRLEEEAKEAAKQTKVVFLSATPFNTRENLDYAEGYIFSYPKDDGRGVSGRTRFYLDHFGSAYKYRYHRLENSVSNPQAVSRQEVEFSDYLQNVLQTMSGRIIDSEYDYSRDFPTVTGEYASRFNEAVSAFHRSEAMMSAVWSVLGNGVYSSALFESMKVTQILPRIEQHLAAGRKVVVFHRRVESSQPLERPFDLIFRTATKQAMMEKDREKQLEYLSEISLMRKKFSDLLEWEKGMDLRMPREQLAEKFGKDNVLFFSGKETTKQKNEAVKKFNDDGSGKNIIVIQEASGKEGISLHDVTGNYQRVLITLALPQSPITALQIEGRIYRIGNRSNAIFEYPLLGLDSEMMLFGQTFNAQVGTTENLALGSKARGLRESFARGIEERSGDVCLANQGVGGKEFDSPSFEDADPFERAVLDFYSNRKITGNRNDREGKDYYPTPEPLGYMMSLWGQISEGESVLEPSAGHGAIARYVPRENMLTAIEPSTSLFGKLQIKAGGEGRKFENTVFENYNVVNKHDVVLMNPPFGAGGRMAVDHVAKAFGHLEEGGRVVAIIPMGSTDKKFEKWYEGEKTAVLTGEVILPAITFQNAGTSVNCRVVVIDKVTNSELRSKALSKEVHVDLSHGDYTKIEDFFEAIRDIEMPERTIDTKAKMRKKAAVVARDLRQIKGVKEVDLEDGSLHVSGRGVWDKLEWGDRKGDELDAYLRERFQRYGLWKDSSERRGKETAAAVYEELQGLCARLAGKSIEEMRLEYGNTDDSVVREPEAGYERVLFRERSRLDALQLSLFDEEFFGGKREENGAGVPGDFEKTEATEESAKSDESAVDEAIGRLDDAVDDYCEDFAEVLCYPEEEVPEEVMESMWESREHLLEELHGYFLGQGNTEADASDRARELLITIQAQVSFAEQKKWDDLMKPDENAPHPTRERTPEQDNQRNSEVESKIKKGDTKKTVVRETAGGDVIAYRHEGWLPELGEGEFSLMERVFSETGEFRFSGDSRIESADDVAYMMRNLEKKSIENTFAVLVKDGVPTIVHLGMGSSTSSMANLQAVKAADNLIGGAERIWFVHNHPSGNLRQSGADIRLHEKLEGMFGDRLESSIIIDTLRGEYSEFSGEARGDHKRPEGSRGDEVTHNVLRFDLPVYSKDFDFSELRTIRDSSDVAALMSGYRMGKGAKAGVLVLNQMNNVVGNLPCPHLVTTEEGAQTLVSYAIHGGGESVIVYGNDQLAPEELRQLGERIKTASGGSVRLLDVVTSMPWGFESAADNGLVWEPEAAEQSVSDSGNVSVEGREHLSEEKRRILDDYVATYPSAPIHILKGVEDIDGLEVSEEDKEAMKEAIGDVTEFPAFYNREDKKIYIFAEGIGETDMAEALHHENVHAICDKLREESDRELDGFLDSFRNNLFEDSYFAKRFEDGVKKMITSYSEEEVNEEFLAYILQWAFDHPIRLQKLLTTLVGREGNYLNHILQDIYGEKGSRRLVRKEGMQTKHALYLQRRDSEILYGRFGRFGSSGRDGEGERGGIAGAFSDAEVSYENDPWSKVWGESIRTKRQQKQYAERMRRYMRDRVNELSEKLGVPVKIISGKEDIDNLPSARHRRSKGWWSSRSGEVVVVLPNNVNVADVENTVVHEVVGHKGLRAFIGEERFEEFLREIYAHASNSIRAVIDKMTDTLVNAEADRLRVRKSVAHERAGEDVNSHYYTDMAEARIEAEQKREQFRREATEEYLADLGGRIGDAGFEKMSRDELTLWGKIKATVQQFLDKFLRGLKIAKSIRLTDKHLGYILFKGWKYMMESRISPDDRPADATGIFAEAEDVIRRRQSGYDDMMTVSEKYTRIEKLGKSTPVEISGKEIEYNPDTKVFKKNALEYGKKLQGEYINEDTGKTIQLQRGRHNGGLKEVLQHDLSEKAHIQSIAAIPAIITKSIYIETRHNMDLSKNPDVTGYEHYVCGLRIGGEDYTVHSIVASDKAGNRYYDHKLSHIEKGRLLDFIEAKQPIEQILTPMSGTEPTIRSQRKINELISLLQIEDEGVIRRLRDGDMSLDEVITKMKVDAASANGADLKAKRDAMKAIGGNLNKLRQAMARQREYDITTVKSITDLSKILLDAGLLDNLSKYETKHILTTIKDSVGKEDTSKQVQRLMDIMVDNQLRNIEKGFETLTSMRTSRVDGRGINVQGALDPDGEAILKTFNNWKDLPAETYDAQGNLMPGCILSRMHSAMDAMNDSNAPIASRATLEYAGLQIAQEYAEKISKSQQSEKELREEVKKAKQEKDAGRMTAKAFHQFKDSVGATISQMKIDRIGAYESLIEKLGGELKESAERAKSWRDREKERVNAIHHLVNSDMQGRELRGDREDTRLMKLRNHWLVNWLLEPMSTLDQMLKMFGSKNPNGEGYMQNHFMRGWIDAADKEQEMKEAVHKQMDEKAAEIFGKHRVWYNGGLKKVDYTYSDIYDYAKALPSATVEYYDGAEMREYEIGHGELLYLYAVDKMPMGRATNRRMGIDDATMQRITDTLDPKLKDYADWVQDELLPRMGDAANEVHKRMFGANMDAIENYFPFVRDKDVLKREVENGQTTKTNDRISVQTGAIKKRVASVAKWNMRQCNFMDVLAKHVDEMTHWTAFAELNRDFGTLLSSNRLKQQVFAMNSVYGAGEQLWKRFQECCAIATDAYEPQRSKFDRLMVQGAKGVTMGKISLKTFTALKQTLSLPAFFGEVNMKYVAADLMTGGVKACQWAWKNMPNFRKRILSRTSGDYRLKENEYDGKIMKASSYGMLPNIGVDAWTNAMGSHGVYMTRKAKYLRWGMEESKAERRAIQDAELCYNKSQQSSEGPFMAPVQIDHTFYATSAMLFRNSSTSYTREAYTSARNLKRLISGEVNKEFVAKQILRALGIKTYSQRFNEELGHQVKGDLPSGHIYALGKPGGILQSAGFPDMPIEMAASRLAAKASQGNHVFPIEAVKGLVESINNPVAVFRYGNNAMNVIIGLSYGGKQFLVGVHFNQQHRGIEVSDVRGLFPKDNAEWLNWISQGKATYLNHKKIQALIDQQRINLAEVTYLNLEDVTKIMNNFHNPLIPDQKYENSWSEENWERAKSFANREIRSAYIRNTVNLAMFGWILPWLWRIGGVAPLLLLGGDGDEKRKQWEDATRQSLLGPIEGLAYGDVIEGGLNYMLPKLKDKKLYQLGRENPIYSDIKEALKKADKDMVAAANDVFNIFIGMTTGVNPQTITDWAVAIIDATDDRDTQREIALLACRLLSVPQSQIDKIYFDELGASGDEARRMAPAQLAERYAEYKMRREAPLTGWMRSGEQKDSIKEKKMKPVLKKAKEALDYRIGTDRTRQLMEDYKRINKLKGEIGNIEDPEEEMRRRASLYETENMLRHRRIGLYNRDIKELTEKYLKARDPEEAASLVELMIKARERMLEDVAEAEAQ